MVNASEPSQLEIPLVGTWSLVSMTFDDRDGNEVAPWGLQPLGRITYTADGRFSAVIASANREMSKPSLAASVESQAAAFRNGLGYAGTYDLSGDTMFHHVDVATDPTWQDTIQERGVSYDGRVLSLSTPPVVTKRDPNGHVMVLRWEKLG
jgi:hypothetical protein